jgi:hypothetical protein
MLCENCLKKLHEKDYVLRVDIGGFDSRYFCSNFCFETWTKETGSHLEKIKGVGK